MSKKIKKTVAAFRVKETPIDLPEKLEPGTIVQVSPSRLRVDLRLLWEIREHLKWRIPQREIATVEELENDRQGWINRGRELGLKLEERLHRESLLPKTLRKFHNPNDVCRHTKFCRPHYPNLRTCHQCYRVFKVPDDQDIDPDKCQRCGPSQWPEVMP